jgi:hypothetical protein
MVNQDDLLIRSQSSAEQLYSLSKSIAAIEVVPAQKDHAGLGAVLQLPYGARVEVCGKGFNDSTVKIRSNNKYYFVFEQDLSENCDAEPRRGPGKAGEASADCRSLRVYA